jgi:adhesin HecA-like repeat protein
MGQSADAKSEFREFRDSNPGVDRHQARQMFRQLNDIGRPERASGVEQRGINAVQLNSIQVVDSVRNNFDRRIINQIERGRTIEIGSNNRLLKMGAGLNLDLTSADRNIVLGEKLMGDGSVQVTVSGEAKSFASGQRVTAAEYLAVKQALGGNQTLELGSNGTASGGTLSIDGLTSEGAMRAASLVVAEGVTAAGNFNKGSAFKLTGDLTNYGTMLVVSDRKGGSLQGDDVLNAQGASIAATGDLHIGAARKFTNDGTVTTGGALTITAGESLKNTSSISAQQDVTLYAPSMENTGTITSNSGNVNLYSPATTALAFNNAGGTISALNGAINVRDASYDGEFNSTITGGDLLSKTLNMNTGRGVMDVFVDELTGTVAQTGYAAHVSANTETLNLGNICLVGDPTYKNSGGDVNITGDLIVGEALVIIARDDVTAFADNIDIVAGNETTGFPITIVAGADLTAGGLNSPTLPAGGLASAATMVGNGSGSVDGGVVVFSGVNQTISSRSTGKKGSGGDIFIGAIEGAGPVSGSVNLSGVSIFTGGRKSKDLNGNVAIAAGATASSTNFMGNIDTTGGNDTTGEIVIRTSRTASSNGSPVTWNANGQITSGNNLFTGSGVSGQAADLLIEGDIVSNGDITMSAADTIFVGTNASIVSVKGDVNLTSLNKISTSASGLISAGNTVDLDSHQIGDNATDTNVSAGVNLRVFTNVGGAFITAFGDITVNDATTVAGEFHLTGQENVTINNNVTADEVFIISTAGDTLVSENSSITATGGPVQVAAQIGEVRVNGNLSGTNVSGVLGETVIMGPGSLISSGNAIVVAGTKKITLGKGSSYITDNGGTISILRETAQLNPVAAPKNTTVNENGAQILFFGAQAKGKKPQNDLEAVGGDITISTTKKSKIILGGEVSMLTQP